MQAYFVLAGAEHIAPYVNRIGNLGADPMELISNLQDRIEDDGYDCKIVAASFKGVEQGVTHLTMEEESTICSIKTGICKILMMTKQ